ncbi:MAG: hypothetical protein ACTSUH_06065 [Candidatus Thorarchaeota archaeon]
MCEECAGGDLVTKPCRTCQAEVDYVFSEHRANGARAASKLFAGFVGVLLALVGFTLFYFGPAFIQMSGAGMEAYTYLFSIVSVVSLVSAVAILVGYYGLWIRYEEPLWKIAAIYTLVMIGITPMIGFITAGDVMLTLAINYLLATGEALLAMAAVFKIRPRMVSPQTGSIAVLALILSIVARGIGLGVIGIGLGLVSGAASLLTDIVFALLFCQEWRDCKRGSTW